MINKYVKLLSILVFSTVLSAQETGYSLSVAGVGMSMDYREYGMPGVYDAPENMEKLLDTEESDLNGIVGVELKLAYTEIYDDDNYAKFGFNFEILAGETQYTGAYQGDPFGTLLSATQDVVFDMELDYKYTYILGDNLEVMCGIGLGYREWYRELQATQIEIYSWYSLRPKLAILYENPNVNTISFGVNLEYQYSINPEMIILANSLNPDTTVNLGSANILEFSIPLKYKYSEDIEFFMQYIYQYQVIDKSDKAPYSYYDKFGTIKDTEIWEPRSEAYNQYLKFGVVFKF